MVRGALRRPHHFESHQAAFEFYRGKRAFAAIADKELMDYVFAAHAPSDQGVTLRFRASGRPAFTDRHRVFGQS